MVVVGMMGSVEDLKVVTKVRALCFLHVIITLLKRREAIYLRGVGAYCVGTERGTPHPSRISILREWSRREANG